MHKQIEKTSSESKNFNYTIYIMFVITCIICLFLIFVTGNIVYFNSDTAAEITQTLAIKETHSLFPEEWIAGSQFLLCSYFVWFFSLVFPDNLIFARNLMELTVFVILIVCLILLCKCVFCNKSGYLVVALCFSGLFLQFNRLYVYYCEYTQAIVLISMFLVLFLKSVDHELIIRNKILFVTSLMVALFSCLIGTQGIQQITIPICVTIFIYGFFMREGQDKKIRRRALILIGAIGIACLIGIVVFKYYLSQRLGIVGLGKLFKLKSIDEIKNLGQLFIQSIVKWNYDESLHEIGLIGAVRGDFRVIVSALLIFVFPVLFIIKGFKNQTRIKDKDTNCIINDKNYRVNIFVIFTVISFLEIVGIFLFSKAYTGGHQVRYFMNSYLLLAIIGSQYVYNRLVSSDKISKAIIVIMISLIIFGGSVYYMSDYEYSDRMSESRELADYLEDNNLTYGYSSYWNASVNSAYSNGRVRINNMHLNGRTIEPYKLFMLDRWYNPERYNGSTFLLLTEKEYNNEYWYDFAYNICGKPIREEMHNDIHILVYDYNISEVMPKVGKAFY